VRTRYDELVQRDADGAVLSAAWWHRLTGAYQPRLSATLYYGQDRATDRAFDYYGRDYYGLVIDTLWSVGESHSPYLQLRYQRADYEGIDPLHAAERSDRYGRATVGWLWRWHARWSWRAEIDYARNASDLALYDFDRTRVYLGARYEVQ
jgi:outer membrane protein